MIKSDKEMKNNSIHHSNLLKLLPNATFANIFPGLVILSESERYILGRIQTPVTPVKRKIQVRCDLHLNHKTADLSCSQVGHLLNVSLFYVTGGKQKD